MPIMIMHNNGKYIYLKCIYCDVNLVSLFMAENKGTSNVNDVPLLAVDVPNQNLERHDDVSTFSKFLNSVSHCKSNNICR